MGILQKNGNGAKDFFAKTVDASYTVCCHLGLTAIRKGKAAVRALAFAGEAAVRAIKGVFAKTKKLLKRPAHIVKREISSVLDFTFRAPYRVIKQTTKDCKEKGTREGLSGLLGFLRETRHVFFKNTVIAASYLLPVGAAILLLAVINSNLADEYVVRVTYNNNVLGYVEDESVFYEGESLMRERIMYSSDETAYYFNPNFEMVRKDSDTQYSDPYMICNELIKNSGDVFFSAYGLYVDDVFYGATTEGEALSVALETLLNSYLTGAENEIVRFHNDVRIREGFYLESSIVELSVLENLIDSKVDYAATYTVVKNDSPYRIANKNGISLETLLALNPEIEKNCYVGQQVIVSEERPLLSVETVVTEQREVKVDYDSVTIPDNSMPYGNYIVTTRGKKGAAIETVEKVYVAGILAETNVVNTEITKQPTTEYVRRGTHMSTAIKPSQGDGTFDFEFIWPVNGGYETCDIDGYRGHTGMDIGGVPVGTSIYASADGVVIKSVKNTYGYGYHIIIDHGNGVQTLYAHCSRLYAKVGDVVEQGDRIALLGATGNAQGKHLHFEIRINGEYKDPADYIGTYYGQKKSAK